MVANSLTARWLRSILALLAFAGFGMLGGCGGGSGAPNNPFAPPPPTPTAVAILPGAATAYSNTPTVLTVEGGVPPYFIVSSDSSVLPVTQAATAGTVVLLASNVVSDTAVTITAQDSIGQTATAAITVRAAPIFNTLTVTPNSTACGANSICSGQTGTAAVTVTGPGGAGIANRQVRFDVVSGPYAIQSPDPANPLVQTRTVVSDVNGVAQVILQATPAAPTQPALLRATELTSGEQQTAQFTIVQTINGSGVLTTIPSIVKFTGPDTLTCTLNFRADVYVYGGKPPYQVAVTQSVPIVAILANVPVATQGGFFTVISNGNCTDSTGIPIVVTDAQGLQTVVTFINQVGSVAPPAPQPPPALQVLPPAVADAACAGKTFTFVVVGGTPQYNVTATSGTTLVGGVPGSVVHSSGDTFQVNGLSNPPPTTSNVVSVIVVDSGSPQQAKTATITCSTP